MTDGFTCKGCRGGGSWLMKMPSQTRQEAGPPSVQLPVQLQQIKRVPFSFPPTLTCAQLCKCSSCSLSKSAVPTTGATPLLATSSTACREAQASQWHKHTLGMLGHTFHTSFILLRGNSSPGTGGGNWIIRMSHVISPSPAYTE